MLANWLERKPTSHGRHAPPRAANPNMGAPAGEAARPKHCVIRAIVVGKTEDKPRPARDTLKKTLIKLFEMRRAVTPSVVTRRPAVTSLASER